MTLHPHIHEFYINGQWVEPKGIEEIYLTNPATEAPIGHILAADQDDLDQAVYAARAGFEFFQYSSIEMRKAILSRCLEAYNQHATDLADAVMHELGAPIAFARSDQVAAGSFHLRGFIEAIDQIEWERMLPNGDLIRREPIGVVGAITPWNWPLNQIALKVFAAISAGCSIVLKPSEITPLSALIFAEIMDTADLPKGVFNMIQGGAEIGMKMSAHPGIDFLSFTGSTRAGQSVQKQSAACLKPVSLELGGKSPNLIFADCDLEPAIRYSVTECFENTGQSCNAPTRMLVEHTIYDEVLEHATSFGKMINVIDPTNPTNGIGPLVSKTQYEKVRQYIQSGIDAGAKLLLGGLAHPFPDRRGYFIAPTIFADVTPEMTIWREEIFGPVLCITPFTDEAHAIALANDTNYGLAAYIQTGSDARANRVACQIKAGMIRINRADFGRGSPFGGYKHSGIGREGGVFGIEEFLEIKTISRPKT